MNNAALPIEKLSTAELILEAAVKRFSEYGYNKTTMAEIAEDAGMSAANIYRYYKSKEEIAAACAKSCMSQKHDVLKEIVRDKNLSASEKLEKYVYSTLELSQEAALENRKIDEVCAEVMKSTPSLVHDKIASNRALLVEILSYGNQTGEFNVEDVMETATAVNAMLVVFDVPMFMSLYSKEEFEEKASLVIKFLLPGLKHQ
jgi:AcrR family transcriptional regulator